MKKVMFEYISGGKKIQGSGTVVAEQRKRHAFKDQQSPANFLTIRDQNGALHKTWQWNTASQN